MIDRILNTLTAFFSTLYAALGPTEPPQMPGVAHVRVFSPAISQTIPRMGLNLGHWTSWGAEQFCNNVVMNPGFEGLIDRAVVVVQHSTTYTFADNAPWLGRPDGFWIGATFMLQTGPFAGYEDRIVHSQKEGKLNFSEFTAQKPLPNIVPGDVIILTKTTDTDLPSQWYLPPPSLSRLSIDTHNTRPKSPGIRALSMVSYAGHPTEIIFYLDAIGDRAGKLFPLEGPWTVSFWCKATTTGAVTVIVGRQGAEPVFQKTITPKATWEKYDFSFQATDLGPPGMIGLQFHLEGDKARVLLDDVSMGPDHPGTFRPELISAIKNLHPGYLRDWTYQLADTLPNRLSDPYARRATRFVPGGIGETYYGYSLPEFLDLCRQVETNPWIVVPPTFSYAEYAQLGLFLKENVTPNDFSEIIVEFGNENWNDLFRGASVPNPKSFGEIANRAFAHIKNGAGHLPIKTVVGGQYVNPTLSMAYLHNTPNADALALAPYFMYQLDQKTSPEQMLSDLFTPSFSPLYELAAKLKNTSKELVVYEVNFHTTGGDASDEKRLSLTAGAAAGSALAQTLLEATAQGVKRQCVYTLAGFDAWLNDRSGHARLWGIYRDLTPTLPLRPTGLALKMINAVLPGTLCDTSILSGDPRAFRIYPFQTQQGWSAVLISLIPMPMQVVIDFPDSNKLPAQFFYLDTSAPFSTNETEPLVGIQKSEFEVENQRVIVSLLPYTTAILLAEGNQP